MSRRLPFPVACLFLFTLAGLARAQDLKLPTELQVSRGRLAQVVIESKGAETSWTIIPPKLDAFREYDPDPKTIKLRVLAYTDGEFYLVASTAVGNKVTQAVCRVVVGTPPVPVPPGPDPGPSPPDPGPKPDPTPPAPAPIPTAGLRVLIVEETANRGQLPPGQADVMFARGPGSLWEFMRAKGAKDAAGNPELRVFDKDRNLSADPPHWQEAMKRPRTSLPWLLVSNGKAGYEGPLPRTTEEVLAIVRKYSE